MRPKELNDKKVNANKVLGIGKSKVKANEKSRVKTLMSDIAVFRTVIKPAPVNVPHI